MISRVRAQHLSIERLDPLPSRRLEPSRFSPATLAASSTPSPSAAQPHATPSRTTSAEPSVLRRYLVDLDLQRAQLDHAIQQATSGRTFSPAELCALQLRVYQYGENLEVFSHLLDRAVSAVKTTLNTQV